MIQKNNIKEFKGVILDCDGVIINSTEQSIQEHQSFAKQGGYPRVSSEQLRRLWGLPWPNIIRAIYSEPEAKRFMEEYYSWELKQKNQYSLFPGALSSINGLREAGLLVSILTDRDQKTLSLHMNRNSVPAEIFFFIQAPYNHQRSELKTFEPTLKQFEQVGLKKENLIYVADTLFDARAAQVAQIEFIGVLTGATTREEFERVGVKQTIDSIVELPSFLGI